MITWYTAKPTKSFIPFLKTKAAKKSLDVAKAIWKGAVDRTPVGSGELRASWNLSVGSPSYKVVGSTDSSPGPSAATIPSPSMPNIRVPNIGQAKFYVTNGKSYARYVEYGSKTITPRLMLTRAVMSVGL